MITALKARKIAKSDSGFRERVAKLMEFLDAEIRRVSENGETVLWTTGPHSEFTGKELSQETKAVCTELNKAGFGASIKQVKSYGMVYNTLEVTWDD